MVCYLPMKAYRQSASRGGGITFNSQKAINSDNALKLPCGQCIGCRFDKSRDWAIRCTHEAKMHAEGCFATFTFNSANMPADRSVSKQVLRKFMRKFRKAIAPQQIRYFAVGEYGSKLSRPHYHALIYGWWPSDAKSYRAGKNPLFTSKFLEEIWGKGFVTIGAISAMTAGYCARYSMKKINGRAAKSHYFYRDAETGEVYKVNPEFAAMSTHPGLGATWYAKYKSDCYPSNFLIFNGHKVGIPPYYDRLLAAENPALLVKLKRQRMAVGRTHSEDNTPERLKVREELAEVRSKLQLARSLRFN